MLLPAAAAAATLRQTPAPRRSPSRQAAATISINLLDQAGWSVCLKGEERVAGGRRAADSEPCLVRAWEREAEMARGLPRARGVRGSGPPSMKSQEQEAGKTPGIHARGSRCRSRPFPRDPAPPRQDSSRPHPRCSIPSHSRAMAETPRPATEARPQSAGSRRAPPSASLAPVELIEFFVVGKLPTPSSPALCLDGRCRPLNPLHRSMPPPIGIRPPSSEGSGNRRGSASQEAEKRHLIKNGSRMKRSGGEGGWGSWAG